MLNTTRVIPFWFKLTSLIVVLGFICWQFAVQDRPTMKAPKNQVAPSEENLNYGLTGKAIANTKQVMTRFFSPVVNRPKIFWIIRTTNEKSDYQDEANK